MLDKCLNCFQTALKSTNPNGPVLHVDVTKRQWRDRWTIFPWNCGSTACALTHAKTMIEGQCQNTPGASIGLACQTEKFLEFIHFEMNAAIHVTSLPLLIESHHKSSIPIADLAHPVRIRTPLKTEPSDQLKSSYI
jgi:hypothetical protein